MHDRPQLDRRRLVSDRRRPALDRRRPVSDRRQVLDRRGSMADHRLQALHNRHPALEVAAPAPSSATDAEAPAGLLAGMALALTAWRRRARVARTFRSLDRHQLRDLGLNPFDQW